MNAEYGSFLNKKKLSFLVSRIDDVKCDGSVETADNPTRQ